MAAREVGRAVLGANNHHPAGASTSDVLKGVGPTPWANNGNRFNSKATGTFPLPEAVRDWNKTEALRKGGVAVYEPVAIVGLPYYEWSKSEGWRPIAVYVRRGRENLRVSDLDHLSRARKAKLLAELKGKIEAELRGVGRGESIADVDVIRSFVERMGRTAGLFQGGMFEGTGSKGYYFHGMLHDQNVSLLGEIMDVGNGEGIAKDRAELRELWKKSAYAWWQTDLKEYKADLKGAQLETALFFRLVHQFNARMAEVTGGGLSEAQVKDIFAKGYRQGRKGTSAADPRLALTLEAKPSLARVLDLSRYRRGDGTLDWKRLTKDRALHEGAGLANFALALFLKELAIVTATGDRARIEEFFEGLLTTDFFKEYGLFVAGARLGEVAYVRYLQRYVRPQFVNGILKTNLVLAAGIALPLIVEGKFEGKAFAISLTSLGLSSAAVKSGVAGIRWVMDLKTARRAGTLARIGTAGRLAKLGGWFYTAAELAVVLYVAEVVETRVHEHLDLAQARAELAAAGQEFFRALKGRPTPAEVDAAAAAYHEAWIGYRDFLYGPLHLDEAQLAQRLEGLARRAKIDADKRQAAIQRVEAHPALKARMVDRYGSLEAYAEHLLSESEAEISKDVNTYVESFNLNRKKHLDEVYFSNRRETSFLAGLPNDDWLLSGGAAGTSGDPWSGRTDLWAEWGRDRAKSSLADALAGAGTNRLQGYEDEASLFTRLADQARGRGQAEVAEVLARRAAVAKALRDADESLIRGNGLIDAKRRSGISESLRGSSGPR